MDERTPVIVEGRWRALRRRYLLSLLGVRIGARRDTGARGVANEGYGAALLHAAEALRPAGEEPRTT